MFAMRVRRSIARLASLLVVVFGTTAVCGSAADENDRAAPADDWVASCLDDVKLRHPDPVTAVAFSPDGRKLLTAAYNRRGAGAIRVWDTATGTLLGVWPLDTSFTGSLDVASSPKAPLVVASSHPTGLTIWDGTTGRVRRRIPARVGSILSVRLSGDGKLVAADALAAQSSPSTRAFDIPLGKEIQIVPEGVTGRMIAVAPDFKKVLTIDGQSLRLWEGGRDKVLGQQVADGVPPELLRRGDAARAKLLQEFPLSGTMVRSASFSADGKTLLVLDTDVKLVAWDTATGKELQKWERGGTDFFLRAALSPDGRRVAAVGRTGAGAVWDVATGWPLLEFRADPVGTVPLTLSRDGRMVAVGRADSGVEVYHVPPSWGRGGLTAKELEVLWGVLAGREREAPAAHRAVFVLADAPTDAVPFLRARLRQPAPPAPQTVAQLIADLDGDAFTTREAAFDELLKVGPAAEAPLRQALKAAPSAEARLRIVSLLQIVEGPARLRPTRALRALELIGNDEARQALATLAEEQGDAWLSREAKATLRRLEKR
jgi:WD40 repeat protein